MGRCARTDVEFKLDKKPFEWRFGMFEVVDERFDKEAKKRSFSTILTAIVALYGH